MIIMRKEILFSKNGKWYNKATGQQFVGKALVNGQWYQYTVDGKRIPLTKPKPNINKWINNLWSMENPQCRGFVNGKFFPFTTANGNTDFGPGIDLSKQTKDFQKKAKQGFTKQQMNAEVNKRAKEQFQKVDEALLGHTAYPDTISPQIKEGLADLRWQTGPLESNYPNLLDAVAHGDLGKIQEESKTYFTNPNVGQKQFDKRRHDFRKKNYFHYADGGQIDSIVNAPLFRYLREISKPGLSFLWP